MEFACLARLRAGLDPELPAGDELSADSVTDDAQASTAPDGATSGAPSDHAPNGEAPCVGQGPDRGMAHWPAGQARMGGFEPGVGSVVDALAVLETPGDLDDDSLHDRTTDLVRLHALVTAQLTSHLRTWDVRCLWGSDRSKSPSARLARDANCAKPTGASWVWLARALARMPLTAEAFNDGRISTDHVRRLANACTDERHAHFSESEAELIDHAIALAGDYAGFARVVSVWEQLTDDDLHDPTDPTDLPKEEQRRKAGRTCRIRQGDTGAELTASLTRVGGEIVRTQLQRIVDELWRHDWDQARTRLGEHAVIIESDLARTNQQRWADALVEMARRAGATRPGDLMPKPLITVHVTAADMVGPIRETFNGLVMTRRDIADLIADQADWERIIYAPGGQPVNLTSIQRNFTGLLRRAVQLRDRTCSHPTCDIDAERCQIDHITEHTDNGPTNITNARVLCPKHNLQRPGRAKTPPRGRADSNPNSDSTAGGDEDGDSDRNVDGDDDVAC